MVHKHDDFSIFTTLKVQFKLNFAGSETFDLSSTSVYFKIYFKNHLETCYRENSWVPLSEIGILQVWGGKDGDHSCSSSVLDLSTSRNF